MSENAGLFIDMKSRRVWVDGRLRSHRLTATECKFVLFLASRDGEVCSREDMVLAVYECVYQGGIDDGRIDAMVERARKKIEEDPSSPRFLKTVHRRGHRLEGYNGNAR